MVRVPYVRVLTAQLDIWLLQLKLKLSHIEVESRPTLSSQDDDHVRTEIDKENPI